MRSVNATFYILWHCAVQNDPGFQSPYNSLQVKFLLGWKNIKIKIDVSHMTWIPVLHLSLFLYFHCGRSFNNKMVLGFNCCIYAIICKQRFLYLSVEAEAVSHNNLLLRDFWANFTLNISDVLPNENVTMSNVSYKEYFLLKWNRSETPESPASLTPLTTFPPSFDPLISWLRLLNHPMTPAPRPWCSVGIR